MARVTVEDCLKNVKNRFELVIVAAKRARQLMHGKEPKVKWDNDKPTVVALREIAQGFVQTTEHESTTHSESSPTESIHTEMVVVEVQEVSEVKPEPTSTAFKDEQ